MTSYYKTKLNVTSKRTEEALKMMAGTYRKIWNYAMDVQQLRLDLSLSYKTHYFTTARLYDYLIDGREKNYPFVKQMDGGMIKSVSLRANESFKRWFDNYPFNTNYRRPRYLSRKKDNMTFKTSGKVKVFYDYIEIPKLGKIKLYEKGYIPQGKTYSNITFSHDGKDWWLSLEIREKDELQPVEGLKGSSTLDITREGDIVFGGKVLHTAVCGEAYKRVEKKKHDLEKKLKRQSLANIEVTRRGPKTRTSRNMLKTKKLLKQVKIKLANLRKDSFKKQACEVARTKLQELHCPASLAISRERQGGLTRLMREKHTLDFFNMIVKRVESAGTTIVRHTQTADICTP